MALEMCCSLSRLRERVGVRAFNTMANVPHPHPSPLPPCGRGGKT